jgi:hypothetical protein
VFTTEQPFKPEFGNKPLAPISQTNQSRGADGLGPRIGQQTKRGLRGQAPLATISQSNQTAAPTGLGPRIGCEKSGASGSKHRLRPEAPTLGGPRRI